MHGNEVFACAPVSAHFSFQTNTALVRLVAPKGSSLSIFREECVGCAWYSLCELPNNYSQVLFNTTSPTQFKIEDDKGTVYDGRYHFGNHGVYNVSTTESGTTIEEIAPAEKVYLAWTLLSLFFLTFLIVEYFSIPTIYKKICALLKRMPCCPPEEEVERVDSTTEFQPVLDGRLQYLDASRGIAILLMIFVNYGGGSFPIFEHAHWNGVTIADFVFPHFLYVAGFASAQSIRYQSVSGFGWDIFPRLLKLFLIGVLLNRNSSWASFRIMGVLQRIALSQGVFHFVRWVILSLFDTGTTHPDHNRLMRIFDVSRFLWKETVLMWLMLISATGAQMLWPLNGCPSTYFGPGGLDANGSYVNCTGGLNYWIDKSIMGDSHLYQHPTCKDLYECLHPFDPEGILGSVFASFNIYAGFHSAYYIMTSKTNAQVNWFFIIINAFYFVLSLVLNLSFLPYNKNLWTLSFALLSTSISGCVHFFFYIYLQGNKLFTFQTLQFTGRHALSIYVLHSLFRGVIPVNWVVSTDALSQTAMALWGVVFHMIIGWVFTYGSYKISLKMHSF